jgi:hypothetical protein
MDSDHGEEQAVVFCKAQGLRHYGDKVGGQFLAGGRPHIDRNSDGEAKEKYLTPIGELI